MTTTADTKKDTSGTTAFLLRRMRQSAEFPAMSESISLLNKLSKADDEVSDKLAATIVKDFALTNKILKVVNSAYYGRIAGKVGTISRAIIILGIHPIRSLATSLIFFDRLTDQAKAKRLKEQIASAMFSALLARETAQNTGSPDAEEVFLSAMFHNIGQILVAYYLPEEDKAIEKLILKEEVTPSQAQIQALGVTFDDLGIAIAEEWNFPDTIIHSMKPMTEEKIAKAKSKQEALRQVACFANEATALLSDPMSANKQALDALLHRYSSAISMDAEGFNTAIKSAKMEFTQLAGKLASNSNQFMQNLTAATARLDADPVLDRDQSVLEPAALPEDKPDAILLQGLQEITALMSDKGNVNQAANVVLETLFRAFKLSRVNLCLKDARKKAYVARLGFGSDADQYQRHFLLPIDYQSDIFHIVLEKQLDVYIDNLQKKAGQQNIPDWFLKISDCNSLLLLPLSVSGKALGLIVAEHSQTSGIQLKGQTLELARSLRNQLALAFQLSKT